LYLGQTRWKNKLKIWLDDTRKAPKGWIKISHYLICKMFILIFKNRVTDISFDHDLGTRKNGNDIAKLIEKLAYGGKINPLVWEIHSANPVGRSNITASMKSAERFWKEKTK
jgi:hypothetical protein